MHGFLSNNGYSQATIKQRNNLKNQAQYKICQGNQWFFLNQQVKRAFSLSSKSLETNCIPVMQKNIYQMSK